MEIDMTRFAPALLLATLLAGPAAALSVDVLPPNLSWPDPAPATQSCTSPADLTTSACKAH